ncbi:iron ABC transporter substrate-binding protein [Brenneria goodwinii]|uniref:Iron ABC transporter substrate-binding protein n=1 Tax=Brenneria goodwinii TaxID=1109412 RepID=A0A0G4K1N5_9GAMM|nr:siderophore ABC transporter substrate-binding protein [Brenneria goodwinii]ATA24260.1 iron ABC transporter substrate-binding protein [Brenneria goodwinii]MCG8155092.1 siderophore ABC transporter substrate-binding protein [Brenneria goodwinii]MCG8159336.1 siderophore ABC transporter substrate-binding protein [Brenneria goodwinii]MCG8164495.1 siderophore ABC transporter substrate-binding protein [Brenneria goodwinii]MCG8168939.1 siderophore ABC transporter substrate-binding protein [Brenneria
MQVNVAFALKTTLLASLLALSGCDQAVSSSEAAKTISVEHAQGTTEVPLHPKKVIVFDPAILDTMDALKIDIAGVPQTSTHLPEYLAKYRGSEYINAGTLFEPNYEALSSAQPDLIIAGGRATDAYEKLSGIAPTISLNVDPKQFMTSFSQRVEQLGSIFGKEDEAKKQLEEFKQQIAQTREKSANAGTALVLMVSGGKMSAYGPGSRFGFIFDELGFKQAAEFPEAGSGRHGNVVTSEFLLSVNPDWLFVLDRDSAIGRTGAGGESAQQVLDNPLVHKTNAWQNKHIVYLDSTSIYISSGLQSYKNLIADVNNALDKK